MVKPPKACRYWVQQLKDRIRSSQIKAALKVNTELLNLYWDLGKEIIEKEAVWGDKWLYKLANDLSAEFPAIKGFSHTNIKYIRRWTAFYTNNMSIGPQPMDIKKQKQVKRYQ